MRTGTSGPTGDLASAAPRRLERPRRRLGRKLALALGATLVTLVGLEIAASFVPSRFAPRRLRDGIYLSTLPLATGLAAPQFDIEAGSLGEPLSEDKPEGQVRVFVFGESSVAGTPYGPAGSAPTALHDALVRALPGRDVVVVNMGRPASVIVNTYYNLLFIERYAPDVVVFYLGINDGVSPRAEGCWAGEHELLHGIWRGLVEHSQLLWVTRSLGPAALWRESITGSGSSEDGGSCSTRTFGFWADLVVARARDMGAQVVAATPVRSEAYALEDPEAKIDGVPFEGKSALYLDLLACAVTETCDLTARFLDAMSDAPKALADGRRFNLEVLDELGDAWRSAAEAHGARLVPFRHVLAEASPGGILLSGRWFSDEVHLTHRGYVFLARAWLPHVLLALGEHVPPELARPEPPRAADLRDYPGSPGSHDPMSMISTYLRRGWLISVVPGLQDLAVPTTPCWTDGCLDEAQARVALTWLHWRAGAAPDLDPTQLERARAFEDTLLASPRPGPRD